MEDGRWGWGGEGTFAASQVFTLSDSSYSTISAFKTCAQVCSVLVYRNVGVGGMCCVLKASECNILGMLVASILVVANGGEAAGVISVGELEGRGEGQRYKASKHAAQSDLGCVTEIK